MKKYLIILSTIFLLLISAIIIFLTYISKKTSRPLLYFPKIFVQNILTKSAPDKLNLVVLGVDRRDDWLEKTETTDTVIFSQINFIQNKAHLFSFPRDLWNYYTLSKINQVYPVSLSKPSNQEKFSYITKNFASISGQPIDRALVLSTDDLKTLADIFGGVDVYLEKGFIDEKYPNEEYIQNPDSDAPIYKTVEFKTGWVHLDSKNITEFVRSRKSSETASDGGTDLGRIERQQQLINALIDKFKQDLSKNPKLIFNLYSFWGKLEHNFTDSEVVSYLIRYGLNLKNIQIVRHSISSGEDSKNDLLYYPGKLVMGQWVFLPQDEHYQSLKDYISTSLISP